MEILDLIPRQQILIQIPETDKSEILMKMLQVFKYRWKDMDESSLIKALLEREKLGSPYLPCQLAIPHVRIPNIEEELAAFATLEKIVDFAEKGDSIPKPTQLVFLVLSPENRIKEYLTILSKISTIVSRNNTSKYLIEAKSSQEVVDILALANQT
ncbi:MAG: PTS sugar transporter subunit IIA [Candidatus Coatesbacteria bacterium]|nr:PTS sugar transporter subunit IIA [Candidatus Coatesbacteria bacterium]